MDALQTFIPAADGASWTTIAPADAGFDAARLKQAADFAIASESPWPRDFYYPDGRYVGIVEWNETGPWSAVSGPVKPRGGPAGLVLKGGLIAAEWGDTSRTDMTFSVTKSYLSLLAGLAVADGLIADIDQRVGTTIDGPWFESAHNAQITWRHLLQQSSEWQGELWGKSDQVDHYRQIGVDADNSRKGEPRPLQTPGTHYEYNDVRVNLLAYGLMRRFGRALPEVLRERVMDPIGASSDWEWHGYDTSDRGTPRAVGIGRRALGWRHVHQRPRPCSCRAARGARRPLGRPADPARALGARDAQALADQWGLRSAVVAQPRRSAASGNAGNGCHGAGCWQQHHLGGPRERYRCRAAVDRPGRRPRLSATADGRPPIAGAGLNTAGPGRLVTAP